MMERSPAAAGKVFGTTQVQAKMPAPALLSQQPNTYQNKRSSLEVQKSINIELIDEKLIGISFQGFYSDKIKDMVKSIKGAKYDQKNKLWQLPMF